MNRNTELLGPVTFCSSGENLSLSFSQDALSSVPNGAVRGFMLAFTWLSGDVALLPLKSQNHRDERTDHQDLDVQRPDAQGVHRYFYVFNHWMTFQPRALETFQKRTCSQTPSPPLSWLTSLSHRHQKRSNSERIAWWVSHRHRRDLTTLNKGNGVPEH